MNQYHIHEDNMPKILKKFATIQKKCLKYGCEFQLNVVGEIYKSFDKYGNLVADDDHSKEYTCRYEIVEVEGTARINDWEFVGTIEHHEPTNLIRQYLTEVIVPKTYYTADCKCDHCQTNRIRKDTYIIRNIQTGDFKQVGKSCLKDYTKGLSAEAVAAYTSIFDELIQGEEVIGMGGNRYYEVTEILSIAISMVDTFGYIKTHDYDDFYNPNCTRDQISKYLGRDSYLLKELENTSFKDPSVNTERAQNIIGWAKAKEDDFSYTTNLKVILAETYCTYKHFGLIASAPAAYKRDIEYTEKTERAKAAKAEKVEIATAHVGSIGERISFEVKEIICLASTETQFGMNYFYKIVDNNNNIYTWSTGKFLDPEKAPSIITGTVKNHTEYKDEKQTVLTRCKVA